MKKYFAISISALAIVLFLGWQGIIWPAPGTGIGEIYTTYRQTATPATPPARYDRLYFKSDDKLYYKTSAGVETQVGGAIPGLTITTPFTNNGGTGGTITWPAGAPTLTIPSGGGTLATGAFATIANYALNTGTTSATFQLLSGSSGIKLKGSSSSLSIRDSGDTAYYYIDSGAVTLHQVGGLAPALTINNASDSKYATIYFVGSTSNRSFNLPDDTGTSLLSNASIASTISDGDTTHSPDGNSVFDALALKMTVAGTGLVERVGATFDGGGSAIALNKIAYVYVPFAGTVSEWTVVCDTAEATMVVDVLRLTYTAGTLPSASMVGAGNKPSPTNFETQAAPSSWTSAAIVAKDVLAFKVTTGAATATWCHVSLDVTR